MGFVLARLQYLSIDGIFKPVSVLLLTLDFRANFSTGSYLKRMVLVPERLSSHRYHPTPRHYTSCRLPGLLPVRACHPL